MKLKSLLLGSAAALVAFSGARAADAVIAEPEPVEYVRVCDAYGAGYFYIPGTETCLKIGGFIRYQIDVKSGQKTWGKTVQANLTFSAKSDTELGTLEGFVELTDAFNDVQEITVVIPAPAGSPPGTLPTTVKTFADKGMGIDSAYISLGGLKMGAYDNAFDGGIVGENDGLGGAKGPTIGYTFASGGFDATIGLDHEGSANETNFVPNVSANAGFSAGAFAVRGFVAYDDKDGPLDRSSFAAKLRAGVDVTEGGRLEAAIVYSNDATNYSFGASNWSIAAAYQQKVSDTVKVSVGAQYWNDVSTKLLPAGTGLAGNTRGFDTDSSAYQIGANVDWTPVTNFLVRAQVAYSNFDNGTQSKDGWAGRLRLQRSF